MESAWDEKRVDAAVKNVVSAANYARSGLMVNNIACLIVILGLWNQTFTWSNVEQKRLRTAAVECNAMGTAAPDPVKCKELSDAFETVNKLNWDPYNSVSIPVVGVRVDSDDILVLGSLAILVLTTWWWWGLRRMYGVTQKALEVANKHSAADRHSKVSAYIYDKITGAFVFLSHTGPTAHEEAVTWIGRKLGELEDGTMRFLRWAIVRLPVGTVLLELAAQLWELKEPSYATLAEKSYLRDLVTSGHWGEMKFRLWIGVGALLIVGIGIRGCGRWIDRTVQTIAVLGRLAGQNEAATSTLSAHTKSAA
jgi:hypothetical protein